MFFYGTPLPGLTISGADTYETWDMIPTSRLFINPPEVKTNYIDLPGANGGLDYTELLIGKPTYSYRKGSWEFMLIPEDRWAEVYKSLCDYLHGREHTVILNGDPNYIYTGRLTVSEWRSSAHNSSITIDYVLNPIAEYSGEEPIDYDLVAAGRVLSRTGNEGKVIVLEDENPVVIDAEELLEQIVDNGDNIEYPDGTISPETVTTAVITDILYGKTAIINDTLIMGRMKNNGAISGNIDGDTVIYTIPEGYHNGYGTVSANIATTEEVMEYLGITV